MWNEELARAVLDSHTSDAKYEELYQSYMSQSTKEDRVSIPFFISKMFDLLMKRIHEIEAKENLDKWHISVRENQNSSETR